MKYTDFTKSVKKKMNNLYLIYGNENYYVDKSFEFVKNQVDDNFKDLNFSYFEGENIEGDFLLSSLQTLPFMSEKRYVVAKNIENFRSKGKKIDETIMDDILKKIPLETIFIIFLDFEPDKRSKAYKTLAKEGEIFEFQKLKKDELRTVLKDMFSKKELEIDNSVLEYFIVMSDYEGRNSNKSLRDLENEIYKLKSYLGESKTVTRESLVEMMPRSLENDIFKLLDHIGAKDYKNAILITRDLIEAKESIMMIISMISRQLRIILQVKELTKLGYTPTVIAQKLSIHPFVAQKAGKQGSRIERSELTRYLNLCLEIDYNIKNGKEKEEVAIDLLIYKLCI